MNPATRLCFGAVSLSPFRDNVNHMDELRHAPDLREVAPDEAPDRIPRPFPLVRYYLLASVLLVVGAFAIINFSTQRLHNDSVVDRLKSEAELDIDRILFEISLAITAYYQPGEDLATSLAANKREMDRAVISALRGEPIPRVDLVSRGGELVYSTDPNAELVLTSEEIAAVVLGLAMSEYESDFQLTLFNGQAADIATVITANAIDTEWSVESGTPVAALVAFRDVTHALPSVTGLIAPERIAIVAGTMAALFVLLSWIVARGHRFTTRAREQLSDLLETEREIRGQLDIRNVQLEEANNAKSQFLSMVSHELKTPLTSIISFTQTLNKSLGDSLNERQTRQFQVLGRNGRLLKLLIDELLDVSAASTGKLRLQIEEVTAEQIANEAVQAVQPLVETRNQNLLISMPEVGLTFTGDPGRLQQVIANVLSNASKYSPIGSDIRFDVLEVGESVCFRVTDKGMGISDDDQKRLFSTFFRTDAAVASGAPGTGLGLVIVHSIVEGHGGVVKIESTVGSGTTVLVEIPLAAALPDVADSEEAAA